MKRRTDGQTDRRSGDATDSTVRPSDRPTVSLPTSGRLLAVDWGEKRIGLALSDPTQTLAQPLDTLSRRSGRRFPMHAFREHIETHQPIGIVVGMPFDSEGSEGASAHAAREMGESIARSTGLPLVYVDERMTTSRVKQAIAEMGGKTRGREEEVDRLAATVLLQNFLDSRQR